MWTFILGVLAAMAALAIVCALIWCYLLTKALNSGGPS